MEPRESLDFCLDGCQYFVEGAAESCSVSARALDAETIRILMKPTLRPGCSCILPSSIFVVFKVVVYELQNLVDSLITNGGPGLSAGDLVLCPRGHHSQSCPGMSLVRSHYHTSEQFAEYGLQCKKKRCKCLIELDCTWRGRGVRTGHGRHRSSSSV